MKSRPSFRRRSSVGPSTYNSQPDSDDDIPLSLSQDGAHVMDRQSSRLSEVIISMDRTSFADPDHLTVLMSDQEGLKQELSLQFIESFKFDRALLISEIFVLNASARHDILCIHERKGQVLHLFHLRRNTGVPTFKEWTKIPALSAAVVRIHRSPRLLVLNPDLILRVHAPWSTRLNIVFPSTRSWRAISQASGNQVTL